MKCKYCKWLKGKKSSIGIACLQPDNQEKWKDKGRNPDGTRCPAVAQYKQPSTKACKRFEAKSVPEPDCMWK